jgi:HK97 family phage portal protein
MFANGIRPSGVLEYDKVFQGDQRQQVKDNIIAPMAGSKAAGSVFLLEAGMKFTPVTINPHDAEMLASRGFHVEEICRWFRVPPVMVGHGEKQTSWGTGVEQQMIGFLTFALRPYLTRIEQAIRRSLIPAEQRGTLYAEFAVEGLLRADSAARAAFYSKALGAGGSPAWMTVDEIRGLENWPAMGGDAAVLPKLPPATRGDWPAGPLPPDAPQG